MIPLDSLHDHLTGASLDEVTHAIRITLVNGSDAQAIKWSSSFFLELLVKIIDIHVMPNSCYPPMSSST